MMDFLVSIVRNRERILFSAKVKSVTSQNDKGTFDVLPCHANFISIIKNKIIFRTLENKNQEIAIKSGILKVWANQVSIFLDVESPLGETRPAGA